MTNDQMHDLARDGARARLATIDGERNAILRIFPELGARPAAAPLDVASSRKNRQRRGMSPAAKKAHRERMRAYWAKRRAARSDAAAPQTDSAPEAVSMPAKQPPTPKGMSPAARKAQGERMRAYWAAKRAEKNGAASTDTPASGGSRSRKGQKAARKK